MHSLRQDVEYAARRLARAPGFTLVAVATLALGIGANSAIFSVVHAVLLRPLPLPEPDRLVQVAQAWKGRNTGVYSPQNFLDVQAQAASFSGLAAIDTNGMTLTGKGAPFVVRVGQVSAGFFGVLRVPAAVGRVFREDENEPDRARVVVLGDALWRTRFGGDEAIVGRSIRLDRREYEVVGVAPAGFSFPEGIEAWTPLEYDAQFRTKSRGAWYLTVIGRLRSGTSVAHAADEVATIADRLARAYPDMDEGVGGTVVPLQEALVGRSREALLLLLGAVGFVLLIACVNVANLLLARVASRESEIAVRQALGAGRGRLLRQLLTESLLLAGLGGGAGILLAQGLLTALLSLQAGAVPRLAEVRIDRAVLAFAALLSIASGLFFGTVPALQATARATSQTLREGGRGVPSGRGRPLGGAFVVAQTALALVLLAGAGLLVRSFVRLTGVQPGFRTESALAFRISLPDSAYDTEARRVTFSDSLMERIHALPGVRSAAAVMALPLSGTRFSIAFDVKGRPPVLPAEQPSMETRVATAGYFETMGIPVLRGRGIRSSDTARSTQVVVLSESAARRFFPDEDPIGQWINVGLGREDGLPRPGGEVVGIVGNVKETGLAKADPPEIYIPYPQYPVSSMDVVMRTSVSPRSLAPAAEAAVHELDPELPVARVRTLEELVSGSVAEPRFYALLLGAFAAMALALASLGIYGVMAYAVTQRSREIGIRVALGAAPRGVLRMVLSQAMALTVAGVSLGVLGALALSRVLEGLLFDLSPTDPLTLAGVAALLCAVGLLASALPARQAARVDPLVALRSE